MVPGAASADTKTVTFDEYPANTRIGEQYHASHGVYFLASEGIQPWVDSAPGKAHSDDNVADVVNCTGLAGCGEGFYLPRTTGRLDNDATAISLYAGFYDPSPSMQTVQAKLTAYGDNDQVVGSDSATVTAGAPFTTKLEIATPSAPISYFVYESQTPGDEGKALAFDDLSITYGTGGSPNFSITPNPAPAEVAQGTTVDVPIHINRSNGSNGNVSFAASGLPPGMTASFSPNPATGTSTSTTLHLTAGQHAAPSNYSQITITATPSPGAGSTVRTAHVLARIRENCDRVVRFPYVDARSDDCMVKNGHQHMATNALVRVNGLVIKPADDSRPTLVIDDQNKTIKGAELTRPWKVSVDSNPDIPIYVGPIDWSFADGGSGPHKVLGFDLSGVPILKGLPITGIETSFLESGKARIKPSVKLAFWPFNYFGAITSSVQFTTDNDHSPDFSGLDIKLAKLDVLALELKDVQLHWQEGGTWSGGAKAVVNFSHKYTIGAGFGIKNGDFDFLRASVSGLNIDIGPAIFLQKIGFEVDRNPLTLVGTIGITAGPKVAGVSAVSVNGALRAVLADPFVVEVDGTAKVADRYKIGDAFLRYTSTGLFEFGGHVDFSWSILSMHGGVDGWVAAGPTFNVDGSLQGCIDVWGPVDVCGDAKAVLSTKGIGGCVGAYGHHVGVGATWDFDFDAFTGCDLSPYSETRPAAHAAAAQVARFTIPKGLRSVAWELVGSGLPPGATLTGPHGERVSVSAAHPDVHIGRFLAQARANGRTFILVKHPAAGFFTRMNVVPFARSCARNREVCTLGFVWDTVTFSPCGPVSVAPGGRPFPTSSHATLGSPLGTVNRATCAAAWNAGRVSL